MIRDDYIMLPGNTAYSYLSPGYESCLPGRVELMGLQIWPLRLNNSVYGANFDMHEKPVILNYTIGPFLLLFFFTLDSNRYTHDMISYNQSKEIV